MGKVGELSVLVVGLDGVGIEVAKVRTSIIL